MLNRLPTRLKGYLITGAGVVMLSPDALIVKDTDVDVPVFVFWRALLMCLVVTLLASWRYKRELPDAIRRCGSAIWICPLAIATSSWVFVAANRLTAAGNVLVIQNMAPLIAGIIGLLFFQQKLRLQTWVVILLCIAGAVMMLSGEMQAGNPMGLLIAAILPFSMAINTTVASAQKGIDTTVLLPFAGIAMIIPAILLGGVALPGWEDMKRILLLGLVFLPAAYYLIQSGPRYITGAEVSLMLILETLLGTLLVWWWVGELPTTMAFIGGGLILLTLSGSALLDLIRINIKARRGVPGARIPPP
ncbi:Membrane protein [Nitrincola lacisaponensis]|uniref:Membrane protein n=1 Tax=Nitrincola lacisaponensis TaxID=267850 RepID=A0A063Y7S6_9GAMM|nr:DMT family transporter [Nitrincola lacisaponensis]KDE41180.1 Membrane protein [Nitrincola lacisaponensis]